MTVNRQWLLAARPSGMIGPQNFKYVETPIPEIRSGEVLVKNLFLSFDPTQRGWMVDREGYLPYGTPENTIHHRLNLRRAMSKE